MFNCGNDSKNKLKGICKSCSKNFEFEEYKKCSDWFDYQQQCDNYIKSFNREICLQRVQKSTLIDLDDERCY